MNQWLRFVLIAPLFASATTACNASQGESGRAETARQEASDGAAGRQVAANGTGGNMTNEQVPINQRFGSLDEYLAFLERTQGPVDGPWYKQVSPGVYELQTGNLRLLEPSEEKRIFTRAELAAKFGFSS